MPIPMEQPRLRTGGLVRRRAQEKETGLQFCEAHLKLVAPLPVHNATTLLHSSTSVNSKMGSRRLQFLLLPKMSMMHSED